MEEEHEENAIERSLFLSELVFILLHHESAKEYCSYDNSKLMITNVCGTSVFEQTMKLGPGDWIW